MTLGADGTPEAIHLGHTTLNHSAPTTAAAPVGRPQQEVVLLLDRECFRGKAPIPRPSSAQAAKDVLKPFRVEFGVLRAFLNKKDLAFETHI